MRNLRSLLFATALMGTCLLHAQAPQSFSYQAVLRDPLSGQPMAGTAATARYVLRAGAPLGVAVYEELQAVTTNDQGLFTAQVGSGTAVSGSFSGISWRSGPYFLEVSLDIGNTGSFTSMGTQQLLSVPYALYAESSNIPDGTEVGQIAHWDGMTWVVDSGLYVHEKRFGIGTTEPEAPLSIQADQAGKLFSVTGQPTPVGEASNDQYHMVIADQNTDSAGLSLVQATSTGDVNRFFIQGSTGFVGIGTAKPVSSLSVVADSTTGEAITIHKCITSTTGVFNPAAWTVLAKPSSSSFPGFSIDDATSGAGVSRLFIADSTGHVGIGTTDPGAPLSIKARSQLYEEFKNGDIPNENDFRLSSGGGTGLSFEQDTTGGSASRLYLQGGTGHVGIGTQDPIAPLSLVSRSVLKSFFQTGDKPSQAQFGFGMTTDSTGFGLSESFPDSLANRIFVASSTGHLGIGTQDPPAALSIETRETLKTYFETGNVPTADQFGFSTDSTGFDIGQGAPNALVSRFFIEAATGNVGVGTTQPTEKYYVMGSTHTYNHGRVGMGVRNSSVMTNTGWALGHLDDAMLARNGAFSLVENDGSTENERLVVRAGGNVGINEGSPDTKLHVSRALSDPNSALSLTEGSGVMVLGPMTDNIVFDHEGIQARQVIAGTTSMQGSPLNIQRLGGDILIHGDATFADDVRVTITNDGKLGLGKSPAERLDVNGAITLGDASSASPADGTIRFNGTDFEGRTGGDWAIFNGDIWQKVDNSDAITYSSGTTPRVGIGMAQPDVTLHVSRPLTDPGSSLALSENTGITVLGPMTNNVVFDYRGLQARHGEFVGDVLNIAPSTLNLQRLGGDILIHGDATFAEDVRVTITSDGKLGLGKSPTERLDVNGAITLGDASSTTPPNGTIRWSGTDFEGRSSGEWVPFDAGWRRVISSNDVHHNSKVGIGIAQPNAMLHVKETNAAMSSSTGAFIENEASSSSPTSGSRIGLGISCNGVWSPNPAALNIGLYVSSNGQSQPHSNLAALLNGSVVIGDLTADPPIGSNGSRVLALQNGTAPASPPSSSSGLPDGGVQLYSASGADGVSTLHVMRGNGEVVKLYRSPAITLADNTPLGPGVDPSTALLIDNMRTRINELEARLQAIGLLGTP